MTFSSLLNDTRYFYCPKILSAPLFIPHSHLQPLATTDLFIISMVCFFCHIVSITQYVAFSDEFSLNKLLQSCLILWALWTVAHQVSLFMGFSRQEYCSGLPCSPPGDFPDPGMEPRSSALQADSLPSEPIYDYRKQRLNINTMQYQLIL